MRTNYDFATKIATNGAMVLCNNLPHIDPEIEYYFDLYDEDGEIEVEIYQWLICKLSESVKTLNEWFPNLKFAYSPLLDCYIICVDHYGTDWRYVMTETTAELFVRPEGEL